MEQERKRPEGSGRRKEEGTLDQRAGRGGPSYLKKHGARASDAGARETYGGRNTAVFGEKRRREADAHRLTNKQRGFLKNTCTTL